MHYRHHVSYNQVFQFHSTIVFLILNPNKAAGPDRLSPRFLIEVSKELSPLYTRLFQKSVDEGYVPRQWKAAAVAPIFIRRGRSITLSTIDPYPLTSVTCKCLEQMIAKHIMSHIETNSILTDS